MTVYSGAGLWLLAQRIQFLGGINPVTQSTLQFFGSYSLKTQLFFGIGYILVSAILFITWRVLKQTRHSTPTVLDGIQQ
jgi:hypothetical protein